MDQYWDWLNKVFVPTIRANEWYNGAPPANLSGKQTNDSLCSIDPHLI